MSGWQQRQFRSAIYGFLVSISLVLGVGAWLNPAQAQINQATVIEVLDGNEVFIQGRQARINSVAGTGQQISTGDSRAGLRFNNGSAGRLRSDTSLTVGQCIQLQQGGIIASGPTNACIGSVRVATRGTTFVAELGTDNQYDLKVLEGAVAIENPVNPINPSQPPPELIVREGEKTSISGNGQVSQLEQITVEDLLAILKSYFSGFTQQLPGSTNLRRVLEERFPGVPLPDLQAPAVRGLF